MKEFEALYFSDFLIQNKRTLNTLALYYDRIFLHDYFGLAPGIDSFLYGRNVGTEYLSSINESEYIDAYVLKGIWQTFERSGVRYNPSSIRTFSKKYSQFIKNNLELINSNVLCFCHSTRNPYSPLNPNNFMFSVGATITDDISEKETLASINQERELNKKSCLFEQDFHKLPLISDTEEDLVRWDRSADLLSTSIIMSAIPAAVPTLSDVPVAAILETREKLKEFLQLFRKAILQGAWEVAKIARNQSKQEIDEAARLYYETNIHPILDEVEDNLSRENDKLRKKLLERTIDKTVMAAKYMDPTEAQSKWDLVGSGLKSLLDIDASVQSKIVKRSPYEYLVRLPKALREI